MKRSFMLAALIAWTGAAADAQTAMPSVSAKGAPAPAATGLPPTALYQTMAEHQWRLLDPRNPSGPRIAILWENSADGSYGALLRFPAGFRSPMHSHSADEYTVTFQGTAIHWSEMESEATAKRMTPGSFTLIRGGVSHVSSCAEGEECIAFLTQSAPFDFTLSPPSLQRPPAQQEQRP